MYVKERRLNSKEEKTLDLKVTGTQACESLTALGFQYIFPKCVSHQNISDNWFLDKRLLNDQKGKRTKAI